MEESRLEAGNFLRRLGSILAKMLVVSAAGAAVQMISYNLEESAAWLRY